MGDGGTCVSYTLRANLEILVHHKLYHPFVVICEQNNTKLGCIHRKLEWRVYELCTMMTSSNMPIKMFFQDFAREEG